MPSETKTEKEARAEQQQTLVADPKHSQKKAPLLDFSILKEENFMLYIVWPFHQPGLLCTFPVHHCFGYQSRQ